MSTVRPALHTNQSGKSSFRKRFSSQRNLKKHWLFFIFVWTEHILGTKPAGFLKWWRYENRVISLKHKFKMAGHSSRLVWTEIIWFVFSAKPPFSNSSGVVLTGSKVQKNYKSVDVPGQFVNWQSFICLSEFLVHCWLLPLVFLTFQVQNGSKWVTNLELNSGLRFWVCKCLNLTILFSNKSSVIPREVSSHSLGKDVITFRYIYLLLKVITF